MATPSVLAFDAEGRAIDFEWTESAGVAAAVAVGAEVAEATTVEAEVGAVEAEAGVAVVEVVG
ncbi:unnamed protein product, partial [Closterium sp. NIES-64]